MSGELEIVDGRALVLTHVPAWHRLSKVTGGNFGEEAILAYAPEILSDVEKVKPYVITQFGVTELPNTSAVVRTIDGKVVGEGVGTETYGLVQARDAFAFGQELAETAGFPLVSAGLIREGRQFFFTYATGEAGIDGLSIETHQTVVSSHDGSLPFMALRSATIVVCANTLAMAIGNGVDRYTFRHTALVEDRMEAFLEARRGVDEHQQLVHSVVGRLATTTINTRQFDLILDGILPVLREDGGSKRSVTNRATARESIRTLYKAPVVQDLGGSALGVVQAVNTYENWSAPIRGRKGAAGDTLRAERQFDAMVKGKQPLTDQAIDYCLTSV